MRIPSAFNTPLAMIFKDAKKARGHQKCFYSGIYSGTLNATHSTLSISHVSLVADSYNIASSESSQNST
jgi:hypothetical protein